LRDRATVLQPKEGAHPNSSHPGPRIDYPAIRQQKHEFLKLYCSQMAEQLTSTPEYARFVSSNWWLEGYALYKVLKRAANGAHWEHWPAPLSSPDPEQLKQLVSQHRALVDQEILIQYLCAQQLAAARAYAESHGVLLMGDIPILIDRDSADVWLYRANFDILNSAGAPPDPLGPEGQDWGFPPYHWPTLAQDNYGWWRKRLELAGNYFQLVRIDHIHGFFRIWTIPRGRPSSEGHFDPPNQAEWADHGSRLLKMMVEFSSILPIGEDLGTVPVATRTCMHELGICGTRVMRWQRQWQGDRSFIPLNQYDPLSLTTVSTHDSEPLKLWWRTDPEASSTLAHELNWSYSPDISTDQQKVLLAMSHRTSSLFHVNLLQEYLQCFEGMSWNDPTIDRINVPGTVGPNNWSSRLRPSIEELISHQDLQNWLKTLKT
jgi:4-alpha-glucanotransferase